MINLWDMIRDSGVVGWLTCFIGIIGAGIMIERAYVLYFKFGMNVEEFFLKAQSLVLAIL